MFNIIRPGSEYKLKARWRNHTKISFSEIEGMSKWRFKKLVKEKTQLAAFKYLMEKKNQPNKQKKKSNLKYEKLEMQDYLFDGNYKTQISQVVFKTRTQTLEIKKTRCGSMKTTCVWHVMKDRRQ